MMAFRHKGPIHLFCYCTNILSIGLDKQLGHNKMTTTAAKKTREMEKG